MDITGLSYYLTGTLNTSSTAANGVRLAYIMTDYAGHPQFTGCIPPGYKYIDIALAGQVVYFKIDGIYYDNNTRHVFSNTNVAHSWVLEVENIGNRTYRCGLQIMGYTN